MDFSGCLNYESGGDVNNERIMNEEGGLHCELWNYGGGRDKRRPEGAIIVL